MSDNDSFDVIVAIPATHTAAAATAAERHLVPQRVRCRVVVLDISSDGDVTAPAGAERVRGSTFTIGAALRALAATAGEAPIILRRADALYDPAQLEQVLAAFREHPDADMLTCNVGLAVGRGVAHVIDPSQDGGRPPQCWDAGLAMRPRAAAEVSTAAWHPVVTQAYLKAQKTGRTHNIPVALTSVSQDTFAASRFSHFADLHLLHAHGEPFGLDTPWLSILLASDRSLGESMECMNALLRQVLPPGTFEVVVVDRGSGQLAAELDALSTSQPMRTLHLEGATRGAAMQAAVQAAVGQLVLFVAEDSVAFPDLAEQHIRTHRDRSGQLLVAAGSQEVPLEELTDAVSRALAGTQPAAWVLDEEGAPLHPARHFNVSNTSALRDSIIGAGGFDPAFDHAAGEELGWRLESQGYELLAVPAARLRRLGRTDVASWLQEVEAITAEQVGIHTASPTAMDAAELHDTTVEGLQSLLEGHGASAGPVRAALRGLAAGPHLFSLENLGGEWAALAKDLEARAEKLLTHLRRLAEAKGRLAGLEAAGCDSYAAILRSQKLPMPGARGTRYLVRPSSDDELGWLSVLARFLVGFGPMDDATLVVFADPDQGGPTAETLRSSVLELTKRVTPGPNGGWADIQIAEASGAPGELVRLVGTVDGWTPTGQEGDSVIEAIAAETGTPAVDSSEWLLRGSGGVEPWGIASTARFKLFAWPDWSSEEELRTVFDVLARPIANREDAALVLRYDIEADGDPEENLARMVQAFEATLGTTNALEVVLLDDIVEQDDFGVRLGVAVQAVAALPSAGTGARKELLEQMKAPQVADLMSVTTQLFSMPPMPLGPLYVPTLSLV